MSTNIVINHPEAEKFEFDRKLVQKFADDLLTDDGKTEFVLAVVLTGDADMQNLNRTFSGKDKTTNVLAFPFTDGEDGFFSEDPTQELGDIVISLDIVIKEAEEYKEPLTYRLCWLITHGFLHLLGMDHEKSDEEAEKMFTRQTELLKKFYPASIHKDT